MVVVFLDSIEHLDEYVSFTLSHKPTTFESYDDKTLRLALRFFWEFIKRLGVSNIFTLLTHNISEGLSILRYGIPQLVLQVTFDGDDVGVLRAQAQKLVSDLNPLAPRYIQIIASSKEMDEYWLIRRESFTYFVTR